MYKVTCLPIHTSDPFYIFWFYEEPTEDDIVEVLRPPTYPRHEILKRWQFEVVYV